MTFESMLSNVGTGTRHITDRYAEYGGPVQEQQFYYAYEPQSQSHQEASSKHTYGGGHKSNAAMSALTLLAFLFFLHILQQCIRDHMDEMNTPQITIMTAGREGEAALKKADAKIDKAGRTDLPGDNKKIENANKSDDENKYLMKINTAQPPSNQNYKMVTKNYADRKSTMNL